MKGIFFQGSIFSRQIFPCKKFFPSKSVRGIFFFLKSPIPHHPSPPQKSNGRPLKLRLRRTGAMRSTRPELDPVSVFFCGMKQLRMETFRFEDENDYQYEIWLPFFRVFSKYRHPGKLHDTFDSPEKYCHLYWRRSQPSPDRTMIRLLTFVSATERSRLSPNLVVEWRRLSRFPAKMTLVHARALVLRK